MPTIIGLLCHSGSASMSFWVARLSCTSAPQAFGVSTIPQKPSPCWRRRSTAAANACSAERCQDVHARSQVVEANCGFVAAATKPATCMLQLANTALLGSQAAKFAPATCELFVSVMAAGNCYARGGILHFLLYDPSYSPSPDPRPTLPLTFMDPSLGRVLAKSGWTNPSSSFAYKCSWCAGFGR